MKFTIAFAALLVSAASAQTVVDIVVGSDDHTTLEALVIQADLAGTLGGEGPFTVFGPTDAAFAALNGAADKFTTEGWEEHLVDILTYHVTPGTVMSTDLASVEGTPVAMVNGETADITASPAMINNANIGPADLTATNGVVHVTDAVLLPTSVTSDIVAIASGADDFSTLVELVGLAGLVETLQGPGPFTLFAPTNDAFAELPAETVALLKSEEGKDQLIDILTYHVFAGNAYASTLEDGTITMVNEDTATVTVGPPVMINDAEVIMPQILTSNGVIHPINKILMPPTDDTPVTPDTPTTADTPATTTAPSGASAIVGSTFAVVSAAVAMLMM